MKYKIIDKGDLTRDVTGQLYEDSEDVQEVLIAHINKSIEEEVLNFEMELFDSEFEQYDIVEVA